MRAQILRCETQSQPAPTASSVAAGVGRNKASSVGGPTPTAGKRCYALPRTGPHPCPTAANLQGRALTTSLRPLLRTCVKLRFVKASPLQSELKVGGGGLPLEARRACSELFRGSDPTGQCWPIAGASPPLKGSVCHPTQM